MSNKKEKIKKGLKQHPDYHLIDQARGRCPHCLASADMDCNCEKSKPEWEKAIEGVVKNYKCGKHKKLLSILKEK